jgi:uncharacterized membrane protein YbhN (UPF0104 family)
MTPKLRARLLQTAKLALSVAALAWLSRTIDVHAIGTALTRLDLATCLLVCLAMLAHIGILAWRWHRIIEHLGYRWPPRDSVRWTFVGVFFNQALPSSIGGDAFRIWALRGDGASMRVAFGSVTIERSTGLVVLAMLVSACAWRMTLADQPSWTVTALQSLGPAAAAALLAVALVGKPAMRVLPPSIQQPLEGLIGGLYTLAVSRGRQLEVLLLATAASFLNLTAAFLIARAVGVTVDMPTFMALAGGASLLAVLPISLGGWGVREASMVALFAPIGAPAEPVVAASLLWGLLPLVVTWPAGLLWWRRRAVPPGQGGSTDPKRPGEAHG